MSHSTVRLGNGKLDAVTELHRVNLSPEKLIRGKPFTWEFHGHRDFPA
jgi:hypothetical protein